MPELQGTSVVNTQYFANLPLQANISSAQTQITSVATTVNTTCHQLQTAINNAFAGIQATVTKILASLTAEIAAIRAQITSLLPLTTIPSSLGGCISWITSAAQPYITAVANFEQQLSHTLTAIGTMITQTEAAIAGMVTQVEKLIANGFSGCGITVPTISMPPIT